MLCDARCSRLHGLIAITSQALIIREVIGFKKQKKKKRQEINQRRAGAGAQQWASVKSFPLDLLSDFTPTHCGKFWWGGGVQVSAGALPPFVAPPPPPMSLSARRRRFWFWTERLSCRSGAQVSRWRSWAFSWAGSAQPRRAGRALCTWPLGGEKKRVANGQVDNSPTPFTSTPPTQKRV